jgi:hypothetical protein
MSGYKTITEKLYQFTKKYYLNELIKGTILFFSLGFLYLFFTLFLEYFLWFKPTARTILFWCFIFVEVFLLIRFVAAPVFRLIGLRKGITFQNASRIIGDHFPEVKDKLLNILQLNENDSHSDLLLASINQKAEELQPIPFLKAIDFTKNKKYFKYTMVPIAIWAITMFSGNNTLFTESLDRVVNYRVSYIPPAPFSFNLKNKDLQVIQGKSLIISLETIGDVYPKEAKIIFDKEQYFLQNNGEGRFSYEFSDVQESIDFYVQANGVQSQIYQIQMLFAPIINAISLQLKYPHYVGKTDETIRNSGNVLVPDGTNITWKIEANQTDELSFMYGGNNKVFSKITGDNFEFSKRIRRSMNYQISSSNENLRAYETLQFSVGVINDEFPKISVQSNIDSISRGVAVFFGQLSDDYGINKLQIVYYNEDNPKDIRIHELPVSDGNVQTFMYQFPIGLSLVKGINYELFFEVYDNDGVNGNKKVKSKMYKYRSKTNAEIEDELLQAQRSTINSLESSLDKQKGQQQLLKDIQRDLRSKEKLAWNDKKKVEGYIKQQEQYKNKMQGETDKLQESLGETKEENKSLQNKKEVLKKRIEELKKADKQQRLLEEIQKLADKLNKEDLVKKAKELAQQNKQQQRSLERTLELVKRFYIEQKTMQIANKLAELANKQLVLEKREKLKFEQQKQIKEEFEALKEQLKELLRDNEKLSEPMEFPDLRDEKKAIEEALESAEKSLEEKNISKAKKSQSKSAQKMKEMSAKMQKAMMEMEANSVEENMEDLRKILENLVTFSFKQEAVMNKFNGISTTHPDYGKDLKRQNNIKSYFEHIDDSLYVLSMRLPKISSKIQDDLATAHYNLDQSLENFSENRFSNGISNQRYVMTASNNLADYLSNMLNSMKNASMKMGKGKGKGSGFSLPDIIKKQGELSKKMKAGMMKGKKAGDKKAKDKEGKKSGSNGKDGEDGDNGKTGKNGSEQKPGNEGKSGNDKKNDLDGEIYEIYRQQAALRQQLQEAIKSGENGSSIGSNTSKKVLKTMEQLERDILSYGYNRGSIQKMQQLNYELLKLERANLEQGKDNKRKAATNLRGSQKNERKALEFKKQFYNEVEILNRHSLPLQERYKLKVREYFSELQKQE